MNKKYWEKASSLAEIISSIAILVTLIYLTVEIKQNNNALNAQSRQAVLGISQSELLLQFENPNLVLSILKDEPLTVEENIKLDVMLTLSMRAREFSWLQYQDGIIDSAQWQTEISVLKYIYSARRTRLWWEVSGKQLVNVEFAIFVDEIFEDVPISDQAWERNTTWSNIQ